jgi:hypothetical protein
MFQKIFPNLNDKLLETPKSWLIPTPTPKPKTTRKTCYQTLCCMKVDVIETIYPFPTVQTTNNPMNKK